MRNASRVPTTGLAPDGFQLPGRHANVFRQVCVPKPGSGRHHLADAPESGRKCACDQHWRHTGGEGPAKVLHGLAGTAGQDGVCDSKAGYLRTSAEITPDLIDRYLAAIAVGV